MKSVSKALILLFSFQIFAYGCGGRAANPVMSSQYGDQNKSCNALRIELGQTEQELRRLMPETDKTGKNTALGVAGLFLIVPWFFMDFKGAEEVEVNALRNRYNTLAIMASEKNCGFKVAEPPKKEEPKTDPENPNSTYQ
jgi:hypothetical protein